MFNKWFHVPIGYNKKWNRPRFFRVEILVGTCWASAGRWPDDTLKVYRQSVRFTFDIGVTTEKVPWSVLVDNS